MSVFKAYLRIAEKNIWMVLMYLMLFFGITMLIQQFAETSGDGFAAESVPVGMIDEDRGAAAGSLMNYIGRKNEVVMLPDDAQTLQEALFYRKVNYIVRIPRGFMENCILGEETLKVTAVPGTYSGYYVEQQIQNFMNSARSYADAGYAEKEIAEAMQTRKEAEVTLADFRGNAGRTPSYAFYYRYLPFLFLNILGYVMGYILMGVRRGSLPERTRASAVSARRQGLEGLAAAGVLATGLWAVCTAGGLILYGREFISSGRAPWYLANSFALLLMALALAYLIGRIVRTSNALSGIVNTVSIGMCFLCGVFVEWDYLSSGVKKAAQFLPVYWYDSVNELLTEHASVTGTVLEQAAGGIGIQLVFAASFVCISLALSRETAV